MTNYHELVPVPPRTDINTGLTAAKQSTMLALFGKPGRLTRDCSRLLRGKLQSQITSHEFNNFTLHGWKPAVDAIEQVMLQVYHEKPELHAVIRSAGMLCCRAVRGSTSNYSNHSWGTAWDVMIQSQIDELGANKVQRGVLELYPYMHKAGFFWGAGYKSRKDVMHFEASDETVRRWFKEING